MGDVRAVLTDEAKADKYPAATMETADATTAANEEAVYANVNTTRTEINTITGYPTDSTTAPNDYVAKVKGNGNKIGPAITLKVMAGDKFNVKVSSWYRTNGASPGTPTDPLPDLIAALINGVSGASTTGSHAVSATELESNGGLTPSATDFINANSESNADGRPRAFLNWILFDEQFKLVESSSGFEQVGANDAFTQHVKNDMSIAKNGYLYVYVSNVTPNIDVFFDNLQVTHIRGAILEETHYYPFGLVMAGISSKAAGSVLNKRKFNKGSELQSQEFSDGSGLELYATQFRSLDPQLGRWWQIDPKPTYSESLYGSMGNNPILNNDQLGDVIEGVNQISAKRELDIIRKSFKGKDAKELRKLFSIGKDGMTFNKMDINSFNAAVSKLKSSDARALATGYMKAINAENSIFVNVLKGDNEVAKIENPRVGSQFKGTDGRPSLIASFMGRQYDEFGGGITSPASSQGNYLVGIRIGTKAETNYINSTTGENVAQPPTTGELNAHEIVGHALASMLGYSNTGQQSIKVSNIYLRSQNSDLYRPGGGNDHGVEMKQEDATSISGYLSPL